MFDDSHAFVTRAFLRTELGLDYRAYSDEADAALRTRLADWSERMQLRETSAEGAFTQTFFVETWAYGEAGRVAPENVTLIPKFSIPGEGAGGGAGEADLALGWFRRNPNATPQVLCEFKDIGSALDAPQNRKGSNRSPVKQCLDYVRGARRGLFGNEPVQPWWGLVTDMNEFRLYWWDRAPAQYLRFVIRRPQDLLAGTYDLLSASEEARFDRFLFLRLFQRDQLLSEAGRPALLRLVERQWSKDQALEGEFYARYKDVRERLFSILLAHNQRFDDRKVQLLRLCQKLLDRFIFAFYCEDMGERMLFPPHFVRQYLKSRSTEPFYDSNGDELWEFFRRLFTLMNQGGRIGQMKVPFINGGLFAPDPEIEALDIPNHAFAATGQGLNQATLEADNNTLLYLCARYNYAGRGDVRESLSLYTLGRIFEQSITELEYRAGELENRVSIAKLSKRKRDGVYYTPEWVVNYLVEHTLGPWFAAAKARCGWPAEDAAPPGLEEVEAYEAALRRIRVVDPACGSGAFLISAFRRLLSERGAVEREKALLSGGQVRQGVDEARLTAEILTNNIFGLDINPAAVEIAKLALWLHSARADSPLSSLDETIRCGNSLVTPDFWVGRTADPDRQERVNAFDWRSAFPHIWPEGEEGGFDIVLGNPPYVKLQNLRAVDPEVASWLQADRGDDTYGSAQTGNFDLYLPFIEKGLRLLAPHGRMAYIAPSLWAVNQYGEGLRRLVRGQRSLERWIDFKSFQVFDEAITYTALQFFSRDAAESIQIAVAPTGAAADVDWSSGDLAVGYDEFDAKGEWLMATGPERELIDRLSATCRRLDDPDLTTAIFQGLITSADAIYHLKRLGGGRYQCKPNKEPPYEVVIEDAIMKPLISGEEAKRYEEPETDTYILFPYERTPQGGMRLLSQLELGRRFPQAWAYLRSWEEKLREREKRAFDDDSWWRFGRNQNLDKQTIPKLIVAQTVPRMRVCADAKAEKYLNNVRVNGIVTAEQTDLFFILGVLNGRVADFVFRRIGKPKMGGYFEANRQFIAPLPVPKASLEDEATVSAMARTLQSGWTRRRELTTAASERLSVLARVRHGERWLWPDLPRLGDVEDQAPRALRAASERHAWAEAELAKEVAARREALEARIGHAQRFVVEFATGELRLLADGASVVSRIYLDEAAGVLTRAYWRWLMLSHAAPEPAALVRELMRPPTETDAPAAAQFVRLVEELADIDGRLAVAEKQINDRLYELYGLTPEERLLVENQQDSRKAA
jgi:hypothetical protein